MVVATSISAAVVFISTSSSTCSIASEVKVLSSQLSATQSQLSELKNTSESQFGQLSSKLDSAVRLSGSIERIDKAVLSIVLMKR